jgi:AcrR family transcriptional regulator
MKSKANVKRQLILKTATQIILDKDFNALTLDTVAKKAGISKGGLLYHFPNKEALIKGMAQHIFEEIISNFYKSAENDPVVDGKWSRAFIEASRLDLEHYGELNVGILATSLLNPDIAKEISIGYQSLLTKLENDGISPMTTTIIRLAIDGLYYSQMLNIAPVDREMQKKVFHQLIEMTKKEK